MLRELEVPAQPLTEWEDDFISSVREQFKSKGTLSEKQFKVLSKVYDEKGS